MHELSLRPAEAADHENLKLGLIALQAHESALHDSRLDPAATAEPYLAWMLGQVAAADGLCLVARQQDSFVGFIAGWVEKAENPAETDDSTTFGYISDICLLPRWRGLGLSGQLLAAMEQHFSGRAIRRLRISTLANNRAALGAYRSAGFQPYEMTLEKLVGEKLIEETSSADKSADASG
ncbi:MAG TPA: GNAT family N-acetyltransferase [Terriglobales bacterium]|nr:GNAT family N-acetyltransferase [Terriglobales bacterium]